MLHSVPQLITIATEYMVECFTKDGELVWKEKFHNRVVTEMLDHFLDATVKTNLGAPAWFVGLIGSRVADAGMTSASPNLGSAGAPFLAEDVGRNIIVKGAGAGGDDLVSTIITFTDTANVILNDNAGTTVANAEAAWEARVGDTAGSHATWTEVTIYNEANRVPFTVGTIAAGAVDNSAAKAVFTMNASDNIFGSFLIDENTKGGSTGILYGMGVFAASSQPVVDTNVLQVQVNLSMVSS